MPKLEELEEEIAKFAQYHEDIGYSEPEIYKEAKEDTKYRGYTAIDHINGSNIRIVGSTKNRFVSIIFSYDLVEDIAERFDEEAAKKYVGEDDTESDRSIETQAALNLLSDIDKEEQKNIEYQLYDTVLNPRVWTDLKTYEDEFVTGFNARGRLYPFDGDVSIQEYERQFSYTVTPATKGLVFLRYTLNLMNEEDSIGGLEEMTSWEVQNS